MNSALMQEWFTRLAFAIAGTVHLPPVAGLLGKSMLEKAYGVNLGSSDLVILMQHRALLFGLLAAACWIAVWQAAWRWPAGGMALLSMLGFVVIAYLQPHQTAIARIAWVDLLAAIPLLLAFAWQALRRSDPW
jgi:hypothetical protein